MSTEFNSLRDYLDLVEEHGFLQRVDNVDWNLEMGALSEVVAFSGSPRALLFDSIKGYKKGYRVASNLYVRNELQALALGLPPGVKGIELVKAWREKARKMELVPPKVVSTGPILENEMKGDGVDVLKFPAPFWHRHDGGRFIGTGDATLTRDPDGGWMNLGVYRSMIHDKNTVGISLGLGHHGTRISEKYWAKGEDSPVVILLGQDPSVYAGACAPVPWGTSELDYAGGLRGKPVEVIKDAETGILIPSEAEIALIGRVPSPEKETRTEGPWGECTGYYTQVGPSPVVHIDRILYRNDPIIQGCPTMHGSAMKHSLGAEILTSATIWNSIEREVPNIKGVYSLLQPCQGTSRIIVVSIEQTFPGHAKQAALAVLASFAGIRMNKMVIVVDADIDPTKYEEVFLAVTSRCNPDRDIQTISGIPSSYTDPSLPQDMREIGEFTTSTLIIDATKKPFSNRNKFPLANVLDQDLRDAVTSKYADVLRTMQS